MVKEEMEKYLSEEKPKYENLTLLASHEANDSDIIYGGSEDNNSEDEEFLMDSSDEEESPENPYGFAILDKSFRNVYTGYAGGIKVDELDQTSNWQFSHLSHTSPAKKQ